MWHSGERTGRVVGLAILAGLVGLAGGVVRGDDPAGQVYITREAAAAHPDFAIQGEYANERLGVQVVALGNGQFTVVIHPGGLPGAGWDGSERQTLEEDAAGVQALVESLGLKKVERRSPTLGLAPPPGAVVLFDGTQESLERHWRPGARRTADGLLMQGADSLDEFQDFTLHLEFLTPFMPLARGQGRGNSGVYLQGRFEVQVLDSFGLAGKMNEAGGLYSIRDPDLNLCLPPLSWQTYDVDFTAARWNDRGEKVSSARVTVRFNGVVVHRDVELPHATTAAPRGEGPEAGPIYLQDHGNPVRYRNIWVLPRDAAREALRPIVPGFERFQGTADADAVAGGRLLLGELACTKCHTASSELAELLLPKEPPILTEVGSRLHPEWMLAFLKDPHGVKPGTTMPALLADLPEAEREAAARALVNFLATTGTLSQTAPDASAAQRGARLFHQIGCTQCHEPRDGRSVASGSSVPLIDLGKKYTVPSLTEFLKHPHKVRPSGRMPGWHLQEKELQELAAYLVGEVELQPLNPNLKVAVYEGSWQDLPNFDELTPVHVGEAAGLDVNAFGRSDRFGLRFEGFLRIDKRGRYVFHLGSDDGSRLLINGAEVVRNGGVHAHEVKSGAVRLDPGVYPVRIEWFEQAGEQSLTLEYEGPDLVRQDLSRRLQMTPEGNPEPKSPPPTGSPDMFVFDPSQVDRGRELFAQLGCASCHQLKVGEQSMASAWRARPLSACRPGAGCLAEEPRRSLPGDTHSSEGPAWRPIPDYALAPMQRLALTAALTAPVEPSAREPQAVIHRTMQAFSCYACHTRGGVGGPTPDRNELFLSTIPEMGDEGRLPPPLDGVGDKLNDRFLDEVLSNGSTDRPYMRTQMPKFGAGNVAVLAAAFRTLDRREDAPPPALDEPEHRVKAIGRQLVGDKGLACIKCHTLGAHRATGIQAIGLHTMHRRLREDWFLRYLRDPSAYRPGTRMPTGFPEGQATIRDVYDGDPLRQVVAIWRYLQDGERAGIPDGLIAEMIELKPTTRPILYRNFIDGLSPRGIAVGYPEKCHLAWDANRMCLALVWHGRFLDASMHWSGRGQGFQRPLGDHILRIEETAAVARLPSRDAPWPTAVPRESGYAFRGYRLDGQGRPTFRYDGPGFHVEDQPLPQPRGEEGSFRRRLTVTASAEGEWLYFRAARGRTIEPVGDGWRVDGAWTVRVRGGGEPFVRESAGGRELIVPLLSAGGAIQWEQEIDW